MVLAPGGNLGGNTGATKPPDTYDPDTQVGNLLFTPDSTYDIGASGGNRPRNIYASNIINALSIVKGDAHVESAQWYFSSTGCSLWSSNGVPSSGMGVNGDFCFRMDTPATSLQRIYVKSAGAWVGIV